MYKGRVLQALVTVAAIAGILPVAATAQTSWTARTTDHFEIHYRQQNQRLIDDVANEAERAYFRISFDLRHELSDRITLIVDQSPSVFAPESGAPNRSQLLLPLEPNDRRPGTLVHEVTHQFEFEMIPRWVALPDWVLEGLADHEASAWATPDAQTVRQAAETGRIPSVPAPMLDRVWGHALFDFVAAEFGNQGLRQYLTALQGSPAVDGSASRVGLGIAEDDFDWAFKRFIQSRFR